MKALILKDLYMIKAHCRMFLLMTAIVLVVSLLGENNMFFNLYPCMLCGMIPVTLVSYDEKFRWQSYSASLPYTRAQLVSAKYIVGLICQLTALLIVSAAHAVKMLSSGSFDGAYFISMVQMMFIAAVVVPSFSMPFIFKFGSEKGRIAFYVAVGVMCALFLILFNIEPTEGITSLKFDGSLPAATLVGIALYALSWYLSVIFYRSREL